MNLHVSTGKIITFPCGCYFEEYDDGGTGNFNWQQCSLHKAAPDMVAALRLYERVYDRTQRNPTPTEEGEVIFAVRFALLKAEGKE